MRRTLLLAGVVLLVLWAPAAAAAQVGAGEEIDAYRVVIDIAPDGTVRFTETITYDFGSVARHGIYRDVVVRQGFDGDHDRIYPFELISVSSPTAPDDVVEMDEGALHRLRIGDPDITIDGVHTYTIEYELQGTLNGFDDHDELYWNVVGPHWTVPISDVLVEVRAPGDVVDVTCFAGTVGTSAPCASASEAGATATFRQDRLAAGQVLTIAVSLPKGAVVEPAPVLDELWSVDKAFEVTPFTVAASAVLGAGVLGGAGTLLWTVGRDRRAVGSVIDVGFATGNEPTQRVGFREDMHWPVEFAPPDGIQPGLIGVLADERVDQVDIAATIIDLAVRGFLRIEEVEKRFRRDDYRLVRLDGKPEHDLEPYENLLLTKLFAGSGGEVLLSDLEDKFAKSYQKVRDEMYQEVVDRGWFDRRPDHVRILWAVVGGLALAVGVGLVIAAAAFTHLGLLAIPFALGVLVLLIGSRKMPRRTAVGHGLLRRLRGFETFIEESEKERARFAEQKHLFSEYLPYAMVFGAVEKWAKAFADLDGNLPPDVMPWYVGNRMFTAHSFSDSVSGFASSAGSVLTSTPGGSGGSGFGGGGFSGGGGGGGGGGSW